MDSPLHRLWPFLLRSTSGPLPKCPCRAHTPWWLSFPLPCAHSLQLPPIQRGEEWLPVGQLGSPFLLPQPAGWAGSLLWVQPSLALSRRKDRLKNASSEDAVYRVALRINFVVDLHEAVLFSGRFCRSAGDDLYLKGQAAYIEHCLLLQEMLKQCRIGPHIH